MGHKQTNVAQQNPRSRLGASSLSAAVAISAPRRQLRRKCSAFDLDMRRSFVDLAKVLPAELDVRGGDILVEPVELSRAGDRQQRAGGAELGSANWRVGDHSIRIDFVLILCAA
jgi:hypothetical protein